MRRAESRKARCQSSRGAASMMLWEEPKAATSRAMQAPLCAQARRSRARCRDTADFSSVLQALDRPGEGKQFRTLLGAQNVVHQPTEFRFQLLVGHRDFAAADGVLNIFLK